MSSAVCNPSAMSQSNVMDSGPRWRTTEEVAERFRTVPSTVRYWRMQGRLKGKRFGKRVLYSEEELRRFEAAAD